MPDPFKKVTPGEEVVFNSETWNSFLDAAKAEKFRKHDRTSETSAQPANGTIVKVKNESGTDLPRNSIVGISDSVFTPTQNFNIYFRGVVPTTAHKGKYAILLDPIGAGSIGRAYVDGVTAVKINITNSAHEGCDVSAGDTSKLVSTGASGTQAQILWKESGTGEKWAIIRFDSGCGCPEQPPPTTCCAFDCGEVYVPPQHLTLTNIHGSCDLYPFHTRSGTGGTGPINGYQWFGVQAVPHSRTTKTWIPASPTTYVQSCSELGAGTTHVSYSVTCVPTSPGRMTLTQGHALMRCGPGWDARPPGSGGDTFYYAMRDTFVQMYTDVIHENQVRPRIGFYGPSGEELVTFGGSTQGGPTFATYASEDDDKVTFDCGVENLATASSSVCVVGGLHVITKPNYNPGTIPTLLYLDDGFGVVPLAMSGPHPFGIPGGGLGMWWGCCTRHVVGGRVKLPSSACDTTPVDFDTEIIYALECVSPSAGYRLHLYHYGCSVSGQAHQTESPGCVTPWTGYFDQIIGGSSGGILSGSCDPFSWGPVSQSFPATPLPFHPLRQIFGDSGTWAIVGPEPSSD